MRAQMRRAIKPHASAARRTLVTISRQLLGKAAPVQAPEPKYRVVIVGGGSAGVSVAAQLLRKLPASEHRQVAVVEPRDQHLYQPHWTMTGGLGLPIQDSARPMAAVMPPTAQWVKERCLRFEPESNSVVLESGRRIEYDVLVVAPGLQQNFHLVPGLAETMGRNGVASIYSFQYAPKVWENILATRRGRAIFTNPATAVNCGGAPQKIAYLADCAWRSRGVRGAIDVEFATATASAFGCSYYREELDKILAEKGIAVHLRSNLVEVDGDARRAVFEQADGQRFTKDFDFLHVTPPMSAPDFVRESPLADANGFVDVDKFSCQHKRYPNVYSLGDAASLPTSRTYAAISSEAPVVVHNLLATLQGKPEAATATYDGYAACPILLGGNKLMLAEFNGYDMKPMGTFPFVDQRKPSYLFYTMKRYVFAQAYWHLMPIGRWYGKRTVFEPSFPAPQAAPAGARALSSRPTAGAPPPLGAPLELPVAADGQEAHGGGGAAGSAVRPEQVGVVTPTMPGDVTLSGSLPVGLVQQLAPRYKGWLYLNGAEHPALHRQALAAAGCRLEVVPVPAGGLTAELADRLVAAVAALPRPLMVQCTSGNRAGAALLLWLARTQGHNSESASGLARDLDLKFFTSCAECGPVRDWVLNQLGGAVSPDKARGASIQGPGYVVEQLFDPQGSCTFTYLVGCTATHEAVLIDPVLGMEERDLALAEERGFRIRAVLETHCHADHVTGGGAVRRLQPGVRTMVSAASGAAADVHLRDGDVVAVGRYALRAVATPGHTDGCMTFVMEGPGEPRAAFTGDALLIRGCGRTDFQQGNAVMLYENVHRRIFGLPPDTKIFPGHDYQGRNMSTVGEERQFNPRLTKSKEEFVKLMAELNLPRPRLMDVAVPQNLVCNGPP